MNRRKRKKERFNERRLKKHEEETERRNTNKLIILKNYYKGQSRESLSLDYLCILVKEKKKLIKNEKYQNNQIIQN